MFAKGESIHTENSYKYSLPALTDLAAAGGFAVERIWTDARRYFSVAYLTFEHSGKDGVLPGADVSYSRPARRAGLDARNVNNLE